MKMTHFKTITPVGNGTVIEETPYVITVRDLLDDNRLIAGYSKQENGWLCEAGPNTDKVYKNNSVRGVAKSMGKSRGVSTSSRI